MKEICLSVILICLVSFVTGGYIPPGPKYPCPPQHNLLYPCRCEKGSNTGLTLFCPNTNLASLAIALKTIGALELPLDQLTVSHSRISRLYGDLLYALQLKVLVIQDTPLKAIEPYTFLGVNRTLQELHLVRTKLPKFPKHAFENLGNLHVLNINGHLITSLPSGSVSGLLPRNLKYFRLTNGTLSEFASETFSSCKNLKQLDLHGNQLNQLSKNQFKGLRDVETLDLSHNNISKIDPSHLGDLSKMKFCNLSFNAISEITRGAFSRNTLLTSLNLNNNKLTKLDSVFFRGLRPLRHVYFRNNLITEVGRGTFKGLNRIGTIDLAGNKIKAIDFQMFYELQYVATIDVSNNEVTEIQKNAFKDLYLVHINLSHNAIKKIENDAFINCANITVLDLSHNQIQHIPSKAFDETTYAAELQLSYNELSDVSKIPLANMSGILVLNVTNNRLVKIPRNSFPKLPTLHTIDLSYNGISEIYGTVFQPLTGLRYLNLSSNSIGEIKSATIGSIATLLELDLSNNVISEVSRGAFLKLSSIQRLSMSRNLIQGIFQLPQSLAHLDLAYNNISNIPPSSWPTMNALQELDLSDNYLEESLSGGAFAGLLTLRKLNLNRNGIFDAPWQSLSDLTSLQHLHLQSNNISSLGRKAFGRLNVFELDLSYNQLENVSIKAFEGLLQLITLNMSHNEIAHIPNGAFQGLTALTVLDLSNNLLEKLDNKTHGLFDECLSMEKLILSHNKISYVTRKTFPNDPYTPYKLRELDLSYNSIPVLTYDFTFGTKKVEHLNLSHNMINEVRRGVIGNMSSLQVLDLSYNDITDLNEPGVFNISEPLHSFYIQSNHLTSLPVKKIKQLKVLDVRQNELEYFNELARMVKNGSTILFEGNEMACDCHVRPLRRWLLGDPTRTQFWEDVTCTFPSNLAGQKILDVNEQDMICPGRDVYEDEEFDTTPDLKFRNVKMENGEVSLTWYVTAKQDIADFRVIVRDPVRSRDPIYQKSYPYNTRTTVLRDVPSLAKGLEMCIVALDSEGMERDAHSLQCRSLPAVALSYSKSNGLLPSALLVLLLSLYHIAAR